MLEDEGETSQALTEAQGALEKAWKQRDDALAQVAAMKTALQKKCGAKAAQVATEKAKLAANKIAEGRAQQRVATDQKLARKEAAKANKAMAAARAAVAKKEKSNVALKAARVAYKKAVNNAEAVNVQSHLARASAKKLAQTNAPDAQVKAAYAKASRMYSKVMDAKMQKEMAKKRVVELQGAATSAGKTAKKELVGAKKFTSDAAGKVKTAMKAEVKVAKEKRQIAEKQARVVKHEEDMLLKESNKLKKKIVVAKVKSKKALDNVETAKLAESRALEAVKLPGSASPAEKKAFQQAKLKILAQQKGSSANYASKIKNIEASLLSAREKMRGAQRKIARLEKKKMAFTAKMASAKDAVQKVKFKKKITALTGAITSTKKVVAASKKKMKIETMKQKKEISDVVKGVVLNKDKGKSAAAQASKESAVAEAKKTLKKP